MRRPTQVEDEGLASLADVETGVCEKRHLVLVSDHIKPSTCMAFSSQRFGFFKDEEEEPTRHFLDACYLCRKPLGPNTDIFMYRLEILQCPKRPFCFLEMIVLFHLNKCFAQCFAYLIMLWWWGGLIYVCRGDTPFCSEGCRQEQMDIDEAMEKNRCLSNINIRDASSKKDPQKSATNNGKSRSFNLRAGTVVAG